MQLMKAIKYGKQARKENLQNKNKKSYIFIGSNFGLIVGGFSMPLKMFENIQIGSKQKQSKLMI